MDKATFAAEYAAATNALQQLAVIELPENDPALAGHEQALETLAAVIAAWYKRGSEGNPDDTPPPVRQIGAAFLRRRFAPADESPSAVR